MEILENREEEEEENNFRCFHSSMDGKMLVPIITRFILLHDRFGQVYIKGTFMSASPSNITSKGVLLEEKHFN